MTMMRRVIDASDIGRYEDRLVDALAEAIGSGRALRMDPFAVEPSTFPDEVAAENERRCIEANIRKHFDRGVALGLFEGRCAIAWHPESGAPQVSAIQPRRNRITNLARRPSSCSAPCSPMFGIPTGRYSRPIYYWISYRAITGLPPTYMPPNASRHCWVG